MHSYHHPLGAVHPAASLFLLTRALLMTSSSRQATFGIHISIMELYDSPSVDSLVRFLLRATLTEEVTAQRLRIALPQTPSNINPKIAIIGMSGKFPGANNVGELWHNLQHGVCSATTISPETYKAKGVREEVWKDEDWVPVAYAIEDADKFDAAFFGQCHARNVSRVFGFPCIFKMPQMHQYPLKMAALLLSFSYYFTLTCLQPPCVY